MVEEYLNRKRVGPSGHCLNVSVCFPLLPTLRVCTLSVNAAHCACFPLQQMDKYACARAAANDKTDSEETDTPHTPACASDKIGCMSKHSAIKNLRRRYHCLPLRAMKSH